MIRALIAVLLAALALPALAQDGGGGGGSGGTCNPHSGFLVQNGQINIGDVANFGPNCGQLQSGGSTGTILPANIGLTNTHIIVGNSLGKGADVTFSAGLDSGVCSTVGGLLNRGASGWQCSTALTNAIYALNTGFGIGISNSLIPLDINGRFHALTGTISNGSVVAAQPLSLDFIPIGQPAIALAAWTVGQGNALPYLASASTSGIFYDQYVDAGAGGNSWTGFNVFSRMTKGTNGNIVAGSFNAIVDGTWTTPANTGGVISLYAVTDDRIGGASNFAANFICRVSVVVATVSPQCTGLEVDTQTASPTEAKLAYVANDISTGAVKGAYGLTGFNSISSSSVNYATGTANFVIGTGATWFPVGQLVRVNCQANANPYRDYMVGTVAVYSGGTALQLTINFVGPHASGASCSSWRIFTAMSSNIAYMVQSVHGSSAYQYAFAALGQDPDASGNGSAPVASTGTILFGGGGTAAYGIDFRAMSFTSFAIATPGVGFQSPGFTVDGVGNVNINSTLDSPSLGNGSLVSLGGGSFAKNFTVGGDVQISNGKGVIILGGTMTAGRVLRSDGTRFVSNTLAFSDITSTCTTAQGCLGLTSAAVGDLIYASATTPTWSRLAAVAIGQVLYSQGVNTAPIWSAAPTLTTSLAVPIIGPLSNSTTALKITQADLVTAIVTVDSTNKRVGINRTPGAFDLDVAGATQFSGIGKFVSGTNSTSTTTGALVVTGGLGISGGLNVGAGASFAGTISTSTSTICFDAIVEGAASCSGNLSMGSGTYAWLQSFTMPLALNPLGNNVIIGGTSGSQTLTVVGDFSASGQTYLANITQTSVAQSGTVCWISTGSPAGKLTVDTTVGCLTSLLRDKDRIEHIEPETALEFVLHAQPVSYFPKGAHVAKNNLVRQPGFIAEQIAGLGPMGEMMTARGEDGELHGVRYMQSSAILAAAIQALTLRMERLGATRQ